MGQRSLPLGLSNLKAAVAFALGASLMLLGCGSRGGIQSNHWQGEGNPPASPLTASDHANSQIVKGRGLQIAWQKQKVDGIEVEDSYYKELTLNGKVEALDYRWEPKSSVFAQTRLLLLKPMAPNVLKTWQKKNPNPKFKKVIEGPTLVLVGRVPRWKILFEEADGTYKKALLNTDGNIMQVTSVGSGLVDAVAALYPSGPVTSQIQDVYLRNLLTNTNLSSSVVSVSTESTVPAIAQNNAFVFAPEDDRFAQVQVYYYLNQSVLWFEQNLGFSLPFQLQAQTQMGFPNKTSTAFYFQQVVHLGDGDGQAFAQMSLDPSIVIHESVHGVVEAVAQLPYQGQGGSINEGFADFFATIQLADPRLGSASYRLAPYKRTVDNTTSWKDLDGGLYHDSGAVSGLFWAVKKQLGDGVAVRLAWDVLIHCHPETDFLSLKAQIQRSMAILPADSQAVVNSIMAQRGWLP
jgi:hypothetical protein